MDGDMPAVGEDVSRSLALVNTLRLRAGTAVDVIADTGTARDWLADRDLIPRSAQLTPAELDRLHVLRSAILALFSAKAAGSVPPGDDVAVINAALAAAPVVPVLTWSRAGPGRSERLQPARPDSSTPAAVSVALARIAADARALLTSEGGPQPAPCGAHGCIRWFLRTHAARQWCSARCGDRVRAARHYARHHP